MRASGLTKEDLTEEEFAHYIREMLELPATNEEISDLWKRMATKDGNIEFEKFKDLVNGFPLAMPDKNAKKPVKKAEPAKE